VTKRYGALHMLDGVSFQVHSRRGVCLIGSSGSGKSTLLRCANPLEPIEGGRISFDGRMTVERSPGRAARGVPERTRDAAE
jgi:polar amino acid transport system ATP-binding protein